MGLNNLCFLHSEFIIQTLKDKKTLYNPDNFSSQQDICSNFGKFLVKIHATKEFVLFYIQNL